MGISPSPSCLDMPSPSLNGWGLVETADPDIDPVPSGGVGCRVDLKTWLALVINAGVEELNQWYPRKKLW
jgi:hypothetical protein